MAEDTVPLTTPFPSSRPTRAKSRFTGPNAHFNRLAEVNNTSAVAPGVLPLFFRFFLIEERAILTSCLDMLNDSSTSWKSIWRILIGTILVMSPNTQELLSSQFAISSFLHELLKSAEEQRNADASNPSPCLRRIDFSAVSAVPYPENSEKMRPASNSQRSVTKSNNFHTTI